MTEIGERLRSERQRLGLSQEAMAELVGASKRTQIDWEQGKTTPTAAALATLDQAGVDVLFVVSGKSARDQAVDAAVNGVLIQAKAMKELSRGHGAIGSQVREASPDQTGAYARGMAHRNGPFAFTLLQLLEQCEPADLVLLHALASRLVEAKPPGRGGKG